MRIKTGDTVRLLSGADRGKTGTVMQVFPHLEKVVVEGLNITKKHLRGNRQQKGKIVDFPAPIHVSNVALVAKDGSTTGRVRTAQEDGGAKKRRVVRRAGVTHDVA